MRLRSLVLTLLAGLTGWGLLVGCGGPMPTPPQQDRTPMTADQPQDQTSQADESASQGERQDAQEPSQTASTPEPSPDRFSVAKEIIRQQSCGSCHTIQARGLDLTGRVGPNLTHEGDRGRTDEWLRQHLVEPTSIPDDDVVDGFEGMQSTMPSYGRRLSDEQINRLAAFLQSLSASDRTGSDQAPQTESSPSETTQGASSSADPFALAKQVIREQGCGSCHTIQARGLNLMGQVGPDLTYEGDRGRTDEWLQGQITNPSTIPDSEVVEGFRGMQSTMPSYERQLSQAELDALVAFLQSLKQSDN